MRLSLNKESTVHLYIQLYQDIRDKILSGELPYGKRLPSERKLSETLEVNRHTVITAYDLLKSDGLLESFSGRGTFVSYKSIEENKCHPQISYYDWDRVFEKKQEKKHDNVIELIMDSSIRDQHYFFAGGLPSNQSIPNEIFQDLSSRLLKDKHLNVLSHSPVSGIEPLRREIKTLMALRGVHSSMKEVLITSGSQQGLDLVFKSFIQPGNTVLIEEPSFFGVIELLKHYGAKIVSIPMDKEGMQTSILEYMIQQHQPKFIYTIPTYHNPTGISMSLDRRQALIALSNKYNVPIIEDDPYSAIVYEGPNYPTLKSMDKGNHVIYISTFSKTVSLGLRIEWVLAPESVIKHLIKMKQISDLHVNTLHQYTMASYLASGAYGTHVKSVIKEYKDKRDIMLNALYKYSHAIDLEVPKGGFYIWITFKQMVSMHSLFERCAKHGVMITPSYHFTPDGKEKLPQVRLNFTYPTEEDIKVGIAILYDCYQSLLK